MAFSLSFAKTLLVCLHSQTALQSEVIFRSLSAMSERRKQREKWCFVPTCSHTSSKMPEKLFFRVPMGNTRKKWCNIVGREHGLFMTDCSRVHCCEDHFELAEDVENWERYCFMKNAGLETFRLKLKKGVLPRYFDSKICNTHAQAARFRSAFKNTPKMVIVKKKSVSSAAISEAGENMVSKLGPDRTADFSETMDAETVNIETMNVETVDVETVDVETVNSETMEDEQNEKLSGNHKSTVTDLDPHKVINDEWVISIAATENMQGSASLAEESQRQTHIVDFYSSIENMEVEIAGVAHADRDSPKFLQPDLLDNIEAVNLHSDASVKNTSRHQDGDVEHVCANSSVPVKPSVFVNTKTINSDSNISSENTSCQDHQRREQKSVQNSSRNRTSAVANPVTSPFEKQFRCLGAEESEENNESSPFISKSSFLAKPSFPTHKSQAKPSDSNQLEFAELQNESSRLISNSRFLAKPSFPIHKSQEKPSDSNQLEFAELQNESSRLISNSSFLAKPSFPTHKSQAKPSDSNQAEFAELQNESSRLISNSSFLAKPSFPIHKSQEKPSDSNQLEFAELQNESSRLISNSSFLAKPSFPTHKSQAKPSDSNQAEFAELQNESSRLLSNSSFLAKPSFPTHKSQEKPSDSNQAEFAELHDGELTLKMTLKEMKRKPKMYMGIDPENMPILDFLSLESGIDIKNVYLVLRKIQNSESWEMLGEAFVYSVSKIYRIFNESLPLIANFLKSFIFWPDNFVIKANIPSAFRANHAEVDTIINCFEIEIAEPSNPAHHAVTSSELKKYNTAKYLISFCPDGFINFVSKGYTLASDAIIVKHSLFLEMLRPGSHIMTDLSCTEIERLFAEKQCTLVRPPRVSSGARMSEDEVILTKVVTSLPVHIERVVKHIQDYSFSDCHSQFHHKSLDLIDNAVTVACALSNMEASILP